MVEQFFLILAVVVVMLALLNLFNVFHHYYRNPLSNQKTTDGSMNRLPMYTPYPPPDQVDISCPPPAYMTLQRMDTNRNSANTPQSNDS